MPDDEPPPKVLPPPPPSSPPPLPPSSSPDGKNNTSSNEKDKIISPNKNSSNIENKRFNESPKDKIKKCKGNKHSNDENVDSCSDIETIEVIQINDIPIPDDDLITIDEDYDVSIIFSNIFLVLFVVINHKLDLTVVMVFFIF